MSNTQSFFNCLNCGSELTRRICQHGFLYRCESCASYATSLPLLRKSLPVPLANRIWSEAHRGTDQTGRECAFCADPMVVRSSHQGQLLEICPRCQIIWFDPGSYPGNPDDLEVWFRRDRLSERARRAIALGNMDSMQRKARLAKRRKTFVNGILRGFAGSRWL